MKCIVTYTVNCDTWYLCICVYTVGNVSAYVSLYGLESDRVTESEFSIAISSQDRDLCISSDDFRLTTCEHRKGKLNFKFWQVLTNFQRPTVNGQVNCQRSSPNWQLSLVTCQERHLSDSQKFAACFIE